MKLSFRSKLLASYLALVAATAGITYLVTDRSLSRQLEAQVDRRLTTQAEGVSRWLARARHFENLAPRLGAVVGARVTFFDAGGFPIGDSLYPGDALPAMQPADTQEVQRARAGDIGHATRFAADEGQRMRFAAVPAPHEMIVRLGVPTAELDDTRAALRRRLLMSSSVALAIALALALLVANTVARPLRRMTAAAEQLGRGDYALPAPSPSPDEIGLLSRTLSATATRLERLEAMRREFLANVAHELRTPVTSIRGYAETLASADVDADTRAEFLATIHRNSLRIARLVDDLLQLQALEAEDAGVGPAVEAVIVRDVAELVKRTVGGAAEERGSSIVIEAPPQMTAQADADRLEQILQNLVENGIKYAGPGATITVRAERRGARVAICVADDGPGIQPAHLPRLFERFFRIDSGRSSDSGGTGLGLAIVKHLAESLGGSVTVESGVERGTTFTVNLPAGGAT